MRTGSVALGDNDDFVVVPLAVPLANSLLTFGVATAEPRPACAMVRGWLNSNGDAVFDRYADACSANLIQYQVVVFASGAYVQRGEGELLAGVRSVTVPLQPVDPRNSFALVSAQQGGNVFSGNDPYLLEMGDAGDAITISAADDGQSVRRYYAWQVVQLAGISVKHFSASLVGSSVDVAPQGTNESVIGTYRLGNLNADPTDPPTELFVGWTASPMITAQRDTSGAALNTNTQIITWPAPVVATSMRVVLSAGVPQANLPTNAEWCFLGTNPYTVKVHTTDPSARLSVASGSVECRDGQMTLGRGDTLHETTFTVWMVDF